MSPVLRKPWNNQTNKSNWLKNTCLYDDDISEMYCEYGGDLFQGGNSNIQMWLATCYIKKLGPQMFLLNLLGSQLSKYW